MTTPEEVISKAISAAKEWLNKQTIQTSRPSLPQAAKETIPPDTYTLSSDAAWRADRKLAGLGWVIKKEDFIAKRMAHCRYVASPLVAEGLAMREAMADCVERGIQRLHCRSDSLILVNALRSGSPIAELHGILADISSLSSAFEFFNVSWTRRDDNKDADALAKQSLSHASFVFPPISGV